MIRSMMATSLLTLLLAVGCSGDEAENATKSMEDAAKSAGSAAEKMAGDMAGHASDMAHGAGAAVNDAAGAAGDMAHNAAAAASNAAQDAVDSAHGVVAGSAVDACRSFAEQGAWGQALDVCKKAHEMMPDDLSLEHAYQQAQAAAN